MNEYKIHFSNGDFLTTGFNGNLTEAKKYYVGKFFNLGNGEHDKMIKVIKIEVI